MSKRYVPISLAGSSARTATGNGTAVDLFHRTEEFDALQFTLDVTADESTTADKLDVFVQTKADGTNWTDVVHFTQHDGDAGATRYHAKITKALIEAEYLDSAALAEATVRDLVGRHWRARWVVVDDSASASYTFSVTMMAV